MDQMEFNSKEEAFDFIRKLYINFYEENKNDFSERRFAQQINISQSVLNTLRNGRKKDIEPEISTKLLRGMNKDTYIRPVLAALLPETSREFFYEKTLPSKTEFIELEKNELGHLADLYTSKTYGHLLAVIFSTDNITVEELKALSEKNETLLQDLEEQGIIDISKGVIHPSPIIKKILNTKKMQFNLSKTIDHAELILNLINPYRVERNKENGYCCTVVAGFHKEDMPEVGKILEEARRRLCELSEKRPGGRLKIGVTMASAQLFEAKKHNKELIQ